MKPILKNLLTIAALSAGAISSQSAHAEAATMTYDLHVQIRTAGGGIQTPGLGADSMLRVFANHLQDSGVRLGASKTHRIVFDGFYLRYPNLNNLTAVTGALQLSRLVKIDGKEQWAAACSDGVFNWRAGPDDYYEEQIQHDLKSYVQQFMARCLK